MRGVIQRVSSAEVVVDGEVIGAIEKGIMVLVGFKSGDSEDTMTYMLNKITGLRIFEDEAGKMNLSLEDIQGQLLIVPNFTLYGDCRKGRRPGYSNGAPVAEAKDLYDTFVKKASELGLTVASGEFQADMKVSLTNDGPVTLLLDSEKEF